jgi:hypothetical protein
MLIPWCGSWQPSPPAIFTLPPIAASLLERGQPGRRGRDVVAKHGAGVDEQNAVGPEPGAGSANLLRILLDRAAAIRPPAELRRLDAGSGRPLSLRKRLGRIVAEELRRIGRLRKGLLHAQKGVDRRGLLLAEEVPEGDVDAGERVVGLQQVEAVAADECRDPPDVGRGIDPLPEHRRGHRLAGRVRHRAAPGGDRRQRRGLAFAPADEAGVGGHADQERILAAVADVVHDRHRKIEKVDRLDLHAENLLGCCAA